MNFVTDTSEVSNDYIGWSGDFKVEKCGKKIKDMSGTISNYHKSIDDNDHRNRFEILIFKFFHLVAKNF